MTVLPEAVAVIVAVGAAEKFILRVSFASFTTVPASNAVVMVIVPWFVTVAVGVRVPMVRVEILLE